MFSLFSPQIPIFFPHKYYKFFLMDRSVQLFKIKLIFKRVKKVRKIHLFEALQIRNQCHKWDRSFANAYFYLANIYKKKEG